MTRAPRAKRKKDRDRQREKEREPTKRPYLPRPFLIIVDHPGQINLLLPRSQRRSARILPIHKAANQTSDTNRRGDSSPPLVYLLSSSLPPPAANSPPRRRGHYGRKLATHRSTSQRACDAWNEFARLRACSPLKNDAGGLGNARTRSPSVPVYMYRGAPRMMSRAPARRRENGDSRARNHPPARLRVVQVLSQGHARRVPVYTHPRDPREDKRGDMRLPVNKRRGEIRILRVCVHGKNVSCR